ncbi:MAG: hypothetical protein HY303_21900, partial [Candidatus Wallbacteria bacterium]|nr:hypothetical protein [Candidatus Wallbacteria bacterium]
FCGAVANGAHVPGLSLAVALFSAVLAGAFSLLVSRWRRQPARLCAIRAIAAGSLVLAIAVSPAYWNRSHFDPARVQSIEQIAVQPERGLAHLLVRLKGSPWDLRRPSDDFYDPGSVVTLVTLDLSSGQASYALGEDVDASRTDHESRIVSVWGSRAPDPWSDGSRQMRSFDLWDGEFVEGPDRGIGVCGCNARLGAGYLAWQRGCREHSGALYRPFDGVPAKIDDSAARGVAVSVTSWRAHSGFLGHSGYREYADWSGLPAEEALVLRTQKRRLETPRSPEEAGRWGLLSASEDGETLAWVPEVPLSGRGAEEHQTFDVAQNGGPTLGTVEIPFGWRRAWLIGTKPFPVVLHDEGQRSLVSVYRADGGLLRTTPLAGLWSGPVAAVPFRASRWRVYVGAPWTGRRPSFAIDSNSGDVVSLDVDLDSRHPPSERWQVCGDTLYWSRGTTLEATHIPTGTTRRLFAR